MPASTPTSDGSGSTAPEDGEDPTEFINTLVTHALDDLEEGRLDIESALRIIARAAWAAGHRQGEISGPQYHP
ncbi:MAG TPA: hypothetical protein VH141_04780 [Pseudonocardia sp.]|nr:hypothetical protein [Pseudonocardia sp.]